MKETLSRRDFFKKAGLAAGSLSVMPLVRFDNQTLANNDTASPTFAPTSELFSSESKTSQTEGHESEADWEYFRSESYQYELYHPKEWLYQGSLNPTGPKFDVFEDPGIFSDGLQTRLTINAHQNTEMSLQDYSFAIYNDLSKTTAEYGKRGADTTPVVISLGGIDSLSAFKIGGLIPQDPTGEVEEKIALALFDYDGQRWTIRFETTGLHPERWYEGEKYSQVLDSFHLLNP